VVADNGNNRIQKFASDRSFVSEIKQESAPIAVYSQAVDSQGNVYAAHIEEGPDAGKMLKFNSSGSLVESWDYGLEEGKVPYGVVASNTHLYAAVVQSNMTINIVKTDLSGNVITEWPTGALSIGMALDSQENLYFYDPANAKVKKFSSSGQLLSQFGEAGTNPGQLNPIDGEGALFARLEIDAFNNIYISDLIDEPGQFYSRIQKFTPNGEYITGWSTENDTGLYGFGVSPDGSNIYVNYAANNGATFQKRSTTDFSVLSTYEPEEDFQSYANINVKTNGRIYASNYVERPSKSSATTMSPPTVASQPAGGDNGGNNVALV
jgi:hypothetical protein